MVGVEVVCVVCAGKGSESVALLVLLLLLVDDVLYILY